MFQPRNVAAISLQNSSFSAFFLNFPVSRKVPKTGVVFVAAAGGCLVVKCRKSDLLGKEVIVL